MKVTFIFKMISFVFLSIFIVTTKAREKNGDFLTPNVSPRVSLMDFLKSKGVKNALIAHYIINSKRSQISISDLNERLLGVTGYSFTNTQIEGWIKNVGDYDTAILKANVK